jgi:hypothetical protein
MRVLEEKEEGGREDKGRATEEVLQVIMMMTTPTVLCLQAFFL